MVTYETFQKYVQGNVTSLIRITKADLDRIKRLIIFEQGLLDAANGHVPTIERYTISIAENETLRDIKSANLTAMERGLKNSIVGIACMGSKGIEYYIDYVYQKFIQHGETEERSIDAKLNVLTKMGRTASSLPQSMREEVENSIVEQRDLINS